MPKILDQHSVISVLIFLFCISALLCIWGVEACHQETISCSIDEPDGNCPANSHCQFGECVPDQEGICSESVPDGECYYPDEICQLGVCFSLFEKGCSEENIYGKCSGEEVCHQGKCELPLEIDIIAGEAPVLNKKRAIFQQFFNHYKHYFAFQKERGIDWQEMYQTFYYRTIGAKYYREFYDSLSDFLSTLHDNHSEIRSQLLCNSQRYETLPVIKTGGNPLDVCGRLINGEYVVYEVGEVNPIGLEVGDAITAFGNGNTLDTLFDDFLSSPRCYNNSYQHLHQAALEFQISLPGMLTWQQEITVMKKDGTEKQTSMNGIPPVFRRCFGFPMKYENNTDLPVYTEDISDDVRYLHTLSFLNIPAQYKELYRKMEGKKGVIIDMRGNKGGTWRSVGGLLVAFLVAPYDFGYCIDNEGNSGNQVIIKPDPIPGFNGKIALLSNEISKSAADFAAYAFLNAELTGDLRIFGGPTGGLFSTTAFGSLEYTSRGLPESLELADTRSQCFTPDGKNLDGYFVVPHEAVDFSKADILEGRDPVIEQALEWIRQAE